MKLTMSRVLIAMDAIRPLMEVRGLSAGAQMALVRLYRGLADERDIYCAAELNLARQCGEVSADGKISFADADAEARYAAGRRELLAQEAEIGVVGVPGERALWDAMTPQTLLQLEGILCIEEGEVSCA